jgi:WD40 repeat protein
MANGSPPRARTIAFASGKSARAPRRQRILCSVSKFAHEGAILNVAFSPDGKTILSTADDLTLKSWDASEVSEKMLFEKQPDVAPGIAFMADGKRIVVGRQDGSVAFYDAEKPIALPPPAPELKSVSPRGLSRGKPTMLKLAGANFLGATNVVASHPDLRIVSHSVSSANEVQIVAEAGLKLPRGEYELSVRGPGGESAKAKVHVDNLPQLDESTVTNAVTLPAGIWGVIDSPGESDSFEFEAKAGETIVLELAVKSIGSKLANGFLTVLGQRGAVLASDSGFDTGDRLVALTIPAGRSLLGEGL